MRDALYASKIISYAQGMDLLGAASRQYKWEPEHTVTWPRSGAEAASSARGFLQRIKEAYDRNPNLSNLTLDGYFTDALEKNQANWRTAVSENGD